MAFSRVRPGLLWMPGICLLGCGRKGKEGAKEQVVSVLAMQRKASTTHNLRYCCRIRIMYIMYHDLSMVRVPKQSKGVVVVVAEKKSHISSHNE